MQQFPEAQEHLPPLAWLAIFRHSTRATKESLLRSSHAVREVIMLMGVESLRFTPGIRSSGQLSRQLCSLLQKRTMPLKLALDMSKGPADAGAVKALLADAVATSRPASGANGMRTCCVQELTIEGTRSARGWGGLLGAAFPNITSLQLPPHFNLNVDLMAGLAGCSRLTTLKLANVHVPPEVVISAHLLPTWLSHMHTLTCNWSDAGMALVRALAGQLQHLESSGWASPQDAHVALAACTQLVSISLNYLDQPVLDALTSLQHLRHVTVVGYVHLHSRTPAQWGVTTLALPSLPLAQLPYLPLASVRKLTVLADMSFTLQPTPAESAASMCAACTALAAVPQLKVGSLCICHKAEVGPAAEVPSHMEGVLGALQPLAAKLGSSLFLHLQHLGGRDPGDKVQQLGPEVLRGLHAAYGDGLTQLSLADSSFSQNWHPTVEFWQALPALLPQLHKLELLGMAPLGQVSVAAAMSTACTELHRAGRPFELVCKWPRGPQHPTLSSAVGQLQALQPRVNVWIQPL